LASYLKRKGRLAATEAGWIVEQIAEGLSWAHARSVVHRDLKPGNVRLDPDGRVIVLDFGIAKVGSVPSTLTQMGFRVGTPHYMAPEQIQGGMCDARTDLYSLGVVAFELLTGTAPFHGNTTEEIWQGHVRMPPPLEKLRGVAPDRLAGVIARLLEKAAENRYQEAKQLAQDLRALGYTEAPGSLQPVPTLDLKPWRASELRPVFEQTRKSDPLVDAAATIPEKRAAPPQQAPTAQVPTGQVPTGRMPTTHVPTGRMPTFATRIGTADVRAEPEPALDAPAEPVRPKRTMWPVYLASAVALLAAVALGIILFLRQEPTPTPPPVDPPVVLEPRIATPTGTMILIEAGEFTFGADNDPTLPPTEQITLPDFYIDETEVPNRIYKEFCDATGRAYPEPPYWDDKYFETKPDHPVANLTYADAAEFAAWAGKRLPSEQEWEKAARGADARLFPWGDEPSTGQHANTKGDSDGFADTAPVGHFSEGAGPFGGVNLIGNVFEWTQSAFTPDQRAIDALKEHCPGAASDTWRIIKGAGFDTPATAPEARAYHREALPVTCKTPLTGFRCAKDANQNAK
jgi:serine/threonine-protein kinase